MNSFPLFIETIAAITSVLITVLVTWLYFGLTRKRIKDSAITELAKSTKLDNLPVAEPYYFLSDREPIIDDVKASLRDPYGKKIIAITGIGGIGKTTLAIEIARRCARERIFDSFIWISAKQQILADGITEKIIQVNNRLDLKEFLDTIARQKGFDEILTKDFAQKEKNIRNILNKSPSLIIIDELENVSEPESFLHTINQLIGSSRCIITSRKLISLDFIDTITLSSLSELDTIMFIKQESQSRKIKEYSEFDSKTIQNIYHFTGGVPLALKWIIAQTQILTLDAVLDRLSSAQGDLYSFLFSGIWDNLSEQARKLLKYIGENTISPTYEELAEAEVFEDKEDLFSAIAELARASLISTEEDAISRQYSINPLVRHYVRSKSS